MDLFTGIGGFSLGLKLTFGPEYRTVCYVENDDYCLQVLKARIADGFLDDAPIWDDITTFEGTPWRGCVDIITAGFPCQPYSVAGKRKGKDDERNLWPDLRRVIGEVEPRYVLLENVPGLLAHQYFGTILGELAESGYGVRWDCVPASAVGTNHQRDRLWILAYSQSEQINGEGQRGLQPFASQRREDVAHASIERERGLPIRQGRPQQTPTDVDGSGEGVADSDGSRCKEQCGTISDGKKQSATQCRSWWSVEPDVGRVAHGVSARVDRLKALGNSIVPAVVVEFLRRVS